MTRISLTVNGARGEYDVAPRQHLADFLRENLLLTGTHLGCEHGVCGACTILIDGEPARSCITFAATCNACDIRTIEGLEHDPIAERLRVAFTAHHALQCGYCTPGMLVTARDIVRRLPDASDDDIRLELAGNLCRCTGYNGIVRAIRQVLDERLNVAGPSRAPVPSVTFGKAVPIAAAEAAEAATPGQGLHQRLLFSTPPAQLWAILRDPQAIVSCIPGASFTTMDGHNLTGEITVAIGPVRARFTGAAQLTYDAAAFAGIATGQGQDKASGTRLSATANFRVEPDGGGSVLGFDIDYSLKGPLAQLAKQRVVEMLADEITAMFAANLRARLAGQRATQAAPLSAFALAIRMIRRFLGLG